MVRGREGRRSCADGFARVGAVVLALVVASVGAAAQDLLGDDGDAPVIIHSQGHQYGFPDDEDPDKLVWVFLDGVEVEQGARRMLGETLVLVLRRGEGEPQQDAPSQDADGTSRIADDRIEEFFLDGEVTLEEGSERLVGASSVHVDNTSGRLSVLDGVWHLNVGDAPDQQPFRVRFDLMRELGGGVREMEGLLYTTCEYAHEHWSLQTPWARLVDTPAGQVLHTGGNTAEVGRTPITWFPGIHLNLDRERPPIRSVGFGTSRRFGTEVMTVWGASADEFLTGVAELFGGEGPVQGDWEVELHNYSSRGVWVQPQWMYQSETSRGRLLTAFIADDNARDSDGTLIQDDTRGRIDLEHRTRLDENRLVDVEISYESDGVIDPNGGQPDGFLKEYYENETRRDKPQESYVSYRDIEDNSALAVLVRQRLNPWHQGPEYAPSITHRITGEPVDLGPVGTAHLTHVAFADSARAASGSYVQRAGTRGELVMDWDVADGDRLQLAGGWDLVGFEDTVDKGGEVRRALRGRAAWIQTWSGVADAESEVWNVDGVRQVLEPRIGYGTVGELNQMPADLIAVDEVETLEPFAAWFAGLRHRIQTHQDGKVVTIFDADLLVPIYADDGYSSQGDTYGPVRAQFLWTPGANIWGLRNARLRWRADYDHGDIQRSFSSYDNTWGEDGRFVLNHSEVKTGGQASTQAAALGLSWQLTPKWSVAWLRREDLLRNEKSFEAIVFRQLAHRWMIDIELSQRRGLRQGTAADIQEENQVVLRARPTAFVDTTQTLLDDLGRIR